MSSYCVDVTITGWNTRHSITDPTRSTIITSIISNDVGAARSHFERVMSVMELRRQEELRQAAAELKTKLQLEEKSREAREKSLMQCEDRPKQKKKDFHEKAAKEKP